MISSTSNSEKPYDIAHSKEQIDWQPKSHSCFGLCLEITRPRILSQRTGTFYKQGRIDTFILYRILLNMFLYDK